MARIRTVKPEFWTDVRLSRLPTLSRLVFLCAISMADDEGRIEGDAETIRNFGFPRESVEDVSKALRALVESSRITRYAGPEGIPLMAIPTFTKHQKIDRSTRSKLPAPPTLTSDSTSPRRAFVEPSLLDQGSGNGSGRGSGNGMEGIQGEAEVAPDGAPARPSKPLRVTSPQEATSRRLAAALGSSINPCRKQVAALLHRGVTLESLETAIESHAEPGLAPWDWTKKVTGGGNGALTGDQIRALGNRWEQA